MKQERRGQPSKPADALPSSAGPRRTLLVSAALVLATIAVYWSVGSHDFVNYDDGDYVTENLRVKSGLSWANTKWAFTSGHASNWHPLTWLSHMADCQLFGVTPGPHHLVNLGLHIANTLLVFFVLRLMTGLELRSAFVAGVFALHPLHVESVAWISERKDVLSTCFLMLTLGAYTLYVRALALQKAVRSRRWLYGLALGVYALGLMSKPMLVTVPFLLLLLDYWPLHRAPLTAAPATYRDWGRLVLEKVPFLFLAAVSSGVTYIVQREGGAVSVSLSLSQRLGNAVVSYVRYIYKSFWPAELAVLYPHPGDWPVWQVLGAAVLVMAISVVVIRTVRKHPYLFVGWFWFVGMLVPVIGLVQVGIQSMADRYTYVPLIGLCIAVAWWVSEFSPAGPNRGRGLVTTSIAVLVLCCLLTVQQVAYWRDSEKLFLRAVEVSPTNYLAYNNLGFFLSNKGQAQKAIEYYRKSLEINPNYEDALNNMGYVLAGLKRHAEAVPYYEAALRVKPRHVEVHNNLGNALSELGRIPEAIQHYQIVLEQKPEHADAHNNLGIALAMQGKLTEAMPHFREAIRNKPNYASAHSNLGNALAAQQKWDEAIVEYEECLRLNPEDAQAHNNLANVFSVKGRTAEAIEHYNTALRLKADNPEAHFNLGIALLKLSRTAEAKHHFAEALRLKPNYLEAQRQLSALEPAPPGQ